MASDPKLVIIGYCNVDINRYPDGREEKLPGGAAYFAALAASLYSKPVGLVTRIGNNFDPSFLLTRVESHAIKLIPDKPAATSIQTYLSKTDSTKRDVKLELGVAHDLSPSDIPHQYLQSATHIHIGTMPPAHQREFIVFLRKQLIRAKLSIDTELSFLKNKTLLPLIVQNLTQCDLVFLNRAEYEIVRDEVGSCKEVVVKYDKDGAVYFQNGIQMNSVKTHAVEAVDATGAGDVFAGVYLASQSRGDSLVKSLQEAAKTATRSITASGVEHLFEE